MILAAPAPGHRPLRLRVLGLAVRYFLSLAVVVPNKCCDTRREAAIDRDQEASTDQVRSVAMGQPQGMGKTFVRSCPNISAEYQASARPLAVCDSLRAGAEPCKVLPQHAAECQASARTLAVCDSLRAGTEPL